MIKLYKTFINIILILLIVILGIYAILNITNKVKIYNVKTGSMEDNIHAGDYVLIYKKDSYKIGDIVTYQKDNYFITHRIIKKEDDKIITKGDANNTIDEEINSSDIVGKVIISGGILNIIVTYKLAIVAVFIALYLISCYFGDKKEEALNIDDNEELKEDTEKIKEENDDIKLDNEEKNTVDLKGKKVSNKKRN